MSERPRPPEDDPPADGRCDECRRLGTSPTAFLRALTHELRTPLGSVLILAELVADSAGERLQPGELDKIAKIRRAAEDLKALIEDVSSLAKVTGGSLSPEDGSLAPGELLAELAEELATQAGEREIAVRGADELPEIATDAVILRRAVTALVRHALAAGAGRVTLRASRRDEKTVALSVTGDGLAVPEDQREHLFEPFAAAAQRRRYGGSALHLPLAAALAELIGAHVEIQDDGFAVVLAA